MVGERMPSPLWRASPRPSYTVGFVPENVWWWVLGGVVLFAVIGVAAWLTNRQSGDYDPLTARSRRRRPPRDAFRAEEDAEPPPLKQLAIVVNPTKVADLSDLRARIAGVCAAHGWAAPRWWETTVADPGTGQARRALEEEVDLVCALGGDGTVRAVAKGLVGTETPLGLLPGGTGNLLARNLDLPLDSIEKALVVALTGHNKSVDVGRIVIDRSGEDHTPEEDHFVVMAGLGFDAAVMAGAPEHLKRQVGNAAYIVAGVRNMKGPQFKIQMGVDGAMPFSRRTRTVLFGNCGRIFGGLVLMPEAKVDDGLVDAVIMSPKGVVGWTAVLGRVLSRQRRGHPIVDHHTGREITVRCDRPQELQLDGDILGPVRRVSASVQHKALVVRVAPPSG